MTTNLKIDRAPMHWLQLGFYAVSVIFNLCLIAQLLTVGIAYFVNPTWWNIHVWLVRGYGGLSLLLLGWTFITPFAGKIQRLTASLPVLLGLQFCSIHLKSPLHLEVIASAAWVCVALCFFNPCPYGMAQPVAHHCPE
jgi:hypothetical protein